MKSVATQCNMHPCVVRGEYLAASMDIKRDGPISLAPGTVLVREGFPPCIITKSHAIALNWRMYESGFSTVHKA